METEYVPFHPFAPTKPAIPAASAPPSYARPVEVGNHTTEIAALKRLVVDLAERVEKAESRLDHVEPTVEGIDQTVQEICRQGGFDDYGDR